MQRVKKIVANNRNDLRGVIIDTPSGNLERKYTQPPKDKKRYRISCSLNSTRYNKFLNYAKAYGAKPATLLQEIAFCYLENKRIVPPVLNEKIKRITGLTGRMANSIQQLRRFASRNQTELFYLDKCKRKILSFEDALEVFVNKANYSAFQEKRADQLLIYIQILVDRVDGISKRCRATESDLRSKDIAQVEEVMKHLNTAITNFINLSASVTADQ